MCLRQSHVHCEGAGPARARGLGKIARTNHLWERGASIFCSGTRGKRADGGHHSAHSIRTCEPRHRPHPGRALSLEACSYRKGGGAALVAALARCMDAIIIAAVMPPSRPGKTKTKRSGSSSRRLASPDCWAPGGPHPSGYSSSNGSCAALVYCATINTSYQPTTTHALMGGPSFCQALTAENSAERQQASALAHRLRR